MVRNELLAQPWPAFVRSPDPHRPTCYGHGTVVARRILIRPPFPSSVRVIYYDVLMADGTTRTFTPDHICDPANVSPRTIGPGPLCIPPAPAMRGAL